MSRVILEHHEVDLVFYILLESPYRIENTFSGSLFRLTFRVARLRLSRRFRDWDFIQYGLHLNTSICL